MRRVIVTAFTFLLAGVVVNVAVAWGIALRVHTYGRPSANVFHAELNRTLFEFSEFTAFGTVRTDRNRVPLFELAYRGCVPKVFDVLPRTATEVNARILGAIRFLKVDIYIELARRLLQPRQHQFRGVLWAAVAKGPWFGCRLCLEQFQLGAQISDPNVQDVA